MRNMKSVALFIGLFFLFSGLVVNLAAAADTEKVRITFPRSIPGGRVQRGNVLLIVHYEENKANRKLVIAWSDEELNGGMSEVDITPENDGVPVDRDLNLSAGRYIFRAELIRSDGSKSATNQERFVAK